MELIRESRDFFNTRNTITLYGNNAALMAELWGMCAGFEHVFSRNARGGDVWRLNREPAAGVSVSCHVINCVKTGLEISELSRGAFQMGLGALTERWSFQPGRERIPDVSDIARGNVHSPELYGKNIYLQSGAKLDLGGIAKGYIADRLAGRVRLAGVQHAMLDLGGNIYVIGPSPRGDGWRIGVQNPHGPRGQSVCAVRVNDCAVVTSSASERSFTKDGVKYHHLLDPETGMPAHSDLDSVTIICENAAVADAAATACFILGSEGSFRFLQKLPQAMGLLLRRDGTILADERLDIFSHGKHELLRY